MTVRQRHFLPLELTMSCDPITTGLQQLAGCQARILPAAAAQLNTETTGCGPHPAPQPADQRGRCAEQITA
jgi:hypothetical protein